MWNAEVDEVLGALEIAGRIKCKAAVVISTGIDAALAAEMHKVARRDGVYLLPEHAASAPALWELEKTIAGAGAEAHLLRAPARGAGARGCRVGASRYACG